MIPEPIRRFATAVGAGDVQGIKNAYPNLTPGQQKKWEEGFRTAKPERAEIRVIRNVRPFDASGVAVVDFVMAIRYRNNPVVARLHYRATLKRDASGTTLAALEDRPK